MSALTKEQFITAIAPAVLLARKEGSALFPSVRLALCLLESGGVIHPWYNLGGVKTGGAAPNAYWRGDAVVKGTKEHIDGRDINTTAAFRAYASVYHYLKDQDLLFAKPRYTPVRAAVTPEQQARMLKACGYATDPAYDTKLISILKQYGLAKYDQAAAVSTTLAFKGSAAAAILRDGLVAAVGYKTTDGVVWAPARALGESLGGKIGWTGTKVTVNGNELNTTLDVSTGYVPVRELAAALGKRAVWDQLAGTVTIEDAQPASPTSSPSSGA
ncbi:glucosaminidase domain-containing protein [Paenibacillus sp. NPDC058071]|uniref:glucosaminidase domain-containing protein n=1 Tax=Paenibacillus sp. NPDC058071 TaxID=3346326 RepID=UPI0036D94CCB